MTGEKKAGSKTRPNYCLLTGKTNDIAIQLEQSSLIVSLYRIINNQTEHQTAYPHLPALIAAGRLIDDLTYIFTSYIGTPKVRKTSIEQLTNYINQSIAEMARGHMSGICVHFPIDGEICVYGLRNIAAGNEPVLTVVVTRNGRISARYFQGGTL